MSNEKSMKDYENELERSFQVLREGDILDVTVIGISDTEVTVDLNYYTEGIIPIEECSDDPSFSIKKDMVIGDTIKAMVLDPENASGNVILSMREANRVLVWDVTGYVKGIRAFIPASQLALTYVEDTEAYVGMTVQAVIITVEKDIQKLVLSAKMIQREQAIVEKTQRIGRLTTGDVVEGPVTRMESYGVFIDIGEGLTGLCHISQITNKFIKSPKEELKMGQVVKAKILKIEGDRISLSIKALREDEPDTENESYEIPSEYMQTSAASRRTGSPSEKLINHLRRDVLIHMHYDL